MHETTSGDRVTWGSDNNQCSHHSTECMKLMGCIQNTRVIQCTFQAQKAEVSMGNPTLSCHMAAVSSCPTRNDATRLSVGSCRVESLDNSKSVSWRQLDSVELSLNIWVGSDRAMLCLSIAGHYWSHRVGRPWAAKQTITNQRQVLVQ
jgi:hypothetical protein